MKDALIRAISQKSRTVLSAMLVLIASGALSYLSLPREADPDIPIPIVYVGVTLPGISPQDAERLIVKPLENELRVIEGLEEITSTAGQNHVGIVLEFDVSFDQDLILIEVREKVDLARPELPPDIHEPLVLEFNTALFPVIVVAVSGDVPERTLFTYSRQLQDALEAIPSVLEANLSGSREEVLEVIVDPQRMEAYQVPYESLIAAVQRQNRLVAAGSLQSEAGRFAVKVPGLFDTVQDVASMPILSTSEGSVTLGDVADLHRTFKDADNFARFNGRPAIIVQVVKRIGENIVATADAVRSVTRELAQNWPQEVQIDFAQDSSVWIHRTLSFLESAVLTAVLLVMIVVVGALGLRSGALVGISIPTSFMTAFLVLNFMGMTINMMVMFAMILSVGLLVDAAIVIVEYADRKMAEGEPKEKAFVMAAQRMFWPIFSSTGTTLAAFIPMLLWPGVPGQFMSYLPRTLIVVLLCSMVTALVFLPLIGRYFGKTMADAATSKRMAKLAGEGGGSLDEMDGFTGTYLQMLRWVIRRPLQVLAVTLITLFSVFYIFSQFNNGVEFFVETEPERGVVFVLARGNLSAPEMLQLTTQVERRVLSVEDVQYVFSSIGSSGSGAPGNDGGGSTPSDTIASIYFELVEYDQRSRRGWAVMEEIRERTQGIPGIYTEVRKQAEGPPTGKDLQIEFRGPDLQTLYAAVARTRNWIEENVEGIVEPEDTRPLPGIEWVLNIDREMAGRFGADTASIGAAVQLVTEGILIGGYRPDDADEEIDIRLRFPPEERALDGLDSLRLQTSSGRVPLSNFVARTHAPLVSSIERVDGERRIVYRANTAHNPETGRKYLADDKLAEVLPWIEKQNFGKGVTWRFRGANEEQNDSAAFLGTAMVAALFLMFLILVTQFNSFYHTFLTLFTVVLSVAGVLIGMMVTGQTFSVIMTGTGIMALAGIVVNNAIVLIDTYHRLLGQFSQVEAVLRTAAQRMRPILLTTITTICGMLPMALQINIDFFERTLVMGSAVSVWWVQLSTAVIFGLAFSTLLTLIFIPVMLAAPAVLRGEAGVKQAAKQSDEDEVPEGARPTPAE